MAVLRQSDSCPCGGGLGRAGPELHHRAFVPPPPQPAPVEGAGEKVFRRYYNVDARVFARP